MARAMSGDAPKQGTRAWRSTRTGWVYGPTWNASRAREVTVHAAFGDANGAFSIRHFTDDV
jgi:hypothetical protein